MEKYIIDHERLKAEKRLNGFHGGNNAGRTCCVVARTMYAGESQGAFEQKYKYCGLSDFYKKVKEEEKDLMPTILLLEILEEQAPFKL